MTTRARVLLLIAVLAGCAIADRAWSQEEPTSDKTVRVVGDVNAEAAEEVASKWALVVGIDRYEKVTPLECCVADARDVAQMLVTQAGFSEEQVMLMTDESERTLRPTKSNLLDGVRNWLGAQREKGKPGDVVVFYFSGHGMRSAAGDDFILPLDATLADLEQSAIPTSWIFAQMREAAAGTVVMVLDACRNIAATGRAEPTKSGFGGQTSVLLEAEEGRVIVLRSCKPEEISQEMPDGTHGVFTHFLLQALGSPDPNEDGWWTVTEVYNFLSDEVPSYNLLNNLPPQHPQLEHRLTGRWADPPLFATPRGRLQLESDPPGMRIWLDGVKTDEVTPATFTAVRPGPHKVLLVGDEGQYICHEIEVASERTAEVSVQVEELEYGTIAFNAFPFATVLLHGCVLGETPMTLPLVPVGTHLVGLDFGGGERYERTVTVEAGTTAYFTKVSKARPR